MAAHLSATVPLFAAPSAQQIRRIVPLGLIVLAHIGFFYALQSGLLKQSGPTRQTTAPKEIFASLIFTESRPQPTPQKQQVVPAQPAPPRIAPTPVKPVPQQKAPTEHAITTPPVAPQAVAQSQSAVTPPVASATAATAPSAPPAATASAQLKTLTTGVEYLQAPQPDYPPTSKRMGEEGRVVLRVLVNEKGRTENVEVQTTSGSTRLDEAARQALKRAQFKPHSEDGRAVAVYAIVPITFHLDK